MVSVQQVYSKHNFEMKGVHLCFEQNGLDLEYCRELIKEISELGFNTLIIEVDNSVRYDSHPIILKSRFYQALCYSRLDRTKESEEILQSLEQFCRKGIAESLVPNVEFPYLLSLVHVARGNTEEARKEAKTAVKISPTHYGANAFLQRIPSFAQIST